jgi:hypothetical protein
MSAPAWITIIEAAKEWSRPPWEIDHHTKPIIWWIRWNIYRRLVIELEREAQQK